MGRAAIIKIDARACVVPTAVATRQQRGQMELKNTQKYIRLNEFMLFIDLGKNGLDPPKSFHDAATFLKSLASVLP